MSKSFKTIFVLLDTICAIQTDARRTKGWETKVSEAQSDHKPTNKIKSLRRLYVNVWQKEENEDVCWAKTETEHNFLPN